MEQKQPILVLFPGAWGHQTRPTVQWCFEFVIAFFTSRGWRVVPLTYTGRTLEEYVQSALRVVDNLPLQARIYALAYSMGAQVVRGVCAARRNRFSKVALLSGLEHGGVRLGAFARGLWFAFWPFVRGLFTGAVMFTHWRQVWRIMYSGKVGTEEAAKEMLTHMAPEPIRVILQLAFPGLRKRMPPLRYMLLAVLPGQDFFLASADYAGETRNRYPVPHASHALLRDHKAMQEVLRDLAAWFNTVT